MTEDGQYQVTARYQNNVFSYEGVDQVFTGSTMDEVMSNMRDDLLQFNIDHAADRNELLPEEMIG